MRALVLLGLLAACSVPNQTFRATPDGGAGDALSSSPAIDPSTTSLMVDEGGDATFTLKLTQAPGDQVAIAIAPAAAADAAAISITETSLSFLPTTWDQPQTVHVHGAVDADAVNAHATIALTSDTLSQVNVDVTVLDPDKVAIATDLVGAMVQVNEGGSVDFHVHLTHQPQADVQVALATASGPVAVTPSTLTFKPTDYDQPQKVTISGLVDANADPENVALTLSSLGLADVGYTIQTIDKDHLNIHATPLTMTIDEGSSADISVNLTAQPTGTVHVTVATTTGKVNVNTTDVMFTTSDWATAKPIHVTAVTDADTVDNTDTVKLTLAGSTEVDIGVTNHDTDVQTILTNAPNPIAINEAATASFGVTLKYQPTGNVTVAVASTDPTIATVSTGSLTFTPTDYNNAAMHQVTVTGVHDNDLATETTTIALSEASIGTTNVNVKVTDIDHQAFVVSKSTLTVAEGAMGSFTVALKYDPGTTTAVAVASSNPTALPATPATISFTGGATGTWATPVTVNVSPPIDTNNVSETATITISASGVPDATVMATATDATVLAQYGWPVTPSMPAFTDTALIGPGAVIAFQITIPTATNLDALGVYVSAAGGYTQLALYRDSGGAPGALVGGTASAIPLSGGANTVDIAPDAPIATTTTTTFWIAVRFSQNTSLATSATATGTVCTRNSNIAIIDTAWPTTFGPSTCQLDYLSNLWINTYHQ